MSSNESLVITCVIYATWAKTAGYKWCNSRFMISIKLVSLTSSNKILHLLNNYELIYCVNLDFVARVVY